MSSSTIDYTYRYAFASDVKSVPGGAADVSLATSDEALRNPRFFSGRIRQPRMFANMLLVLSEIVRSHFFIQRQTLMDPVITSSPEMLRLEGFSGCCGVYVRVDLEHDFFDGQILDQGTTNVDFNDPLRNALGRIGDTHDVQFHVGRDVVELSANQENYSEKKVKLPIRWIKGFGEVQAYLPRLQPKLEIARAEALRFLRGLPRSSAPRQQVWASSLGKSLRLSQRPQRGAVGLTGTHRIRLMEPLFHEPGTLRVYDDPDTQVSGWEYRGGSARLLVLLSPEVYRGFSGEGQILESLSGTRWQDVLESVKARLISGNSINSDQLSTDLNCERDSVTAALAVLGTRGLAGFDLNDETYFYRQLPFHLNEVEKLQPRLIAARKLIEQGGIEIRKRIVRDDVDTEYDITAAGSGVDHLVRLRNDQDRCSCPWFSRYRGKRGPCKHILAARMTVDEGDPDPLN